ncbi:MAG: RnfABCDGE type electron transport complex subunit D [Ferruginibacter sp.]
MRLSLFKDARHFQLLFQSAFLLYGIVFLNWEGEWNLYSVYFLVSIITQLLADYVINIKNKQQLLSKIFLRNLPSALISSFGLSLLLKTNSLYVAAAAAVISILSKYMLRINKKHIFNPSALGIAVTVYFTNDAWISPGQWGSNAVLFFGIICLGCIVVTRVQKLDISLAFLVSFAGLLFARQILYLGWPMDFFTQSISTGSLLLFSFFMISDPKTTPNHTAARIIWAAAVAVVAFYLATFKFINGAPIWVLVCMQPLVPLFDYLFKAKKFEWSSPASLNTLIIK